MTSEDRYRMTVAALLGEPWPMPPDLPGRVHVCEDRPLQPHELVGITSPTELALLTGMSRQTAHNRLKAAPATTTEGK